MSEKYLHEMIDDIEVLIDEAKPARQRLLQFPSETGRSVSEL